MDAYIHVIAWIGFVLFIIALMVEPALFGHERAPYSFGPWFTKVMISIVLTIPVYLRVLGFI